MPPALGVSGLSRPPGVGDQGQDGAAERGGRPARATMPAGNRTPRPPSRGPKKYKGGGE